MTEGHPLYSETFEMIGQSRVIAKQQDGKIELRNVNEGAFWVPLEFDDRNHTAPEPRDAWLHEVKQIQVDARGEALRYTLLYQGEEKIPNKR